MFNYGLGGNQENRDVSEAITEIANNKTLLIQKLTFNDPVQPEIVYGLKSMVDVFNYFKPFCKVKFEDNVNSETKESFKFDCIGDFNTKSIINQSQYLTELKIEIDQYNKILKLINSNTNLKTLLDDKEIKSALIDSISSLLNELNYTDSL